MATCKAFLRDKSKNNEFKIWVKYTHQSKWKPFSTGISIKAEHFDKDTGAILETHPNHYEFNAIVHALSSHLLSLAKTLESKFIKPTPDNIRSLYDENPFIQNRKTLKLQEEKRKALEKAQKREVCKPFDISKVKDMPLKEFLKTDIAQFEVKQLMQKYGEPSVIKKANGEEVVVKQLTALEFLKVLTPQFKSHNTRLGYIEFKRYADRFIEDNIDIEDSTRNQRRSWLNTILDFSFRADVPLVWDNFDQDFYKAYGRWLMYGKIDEVNKNDLYNNTFGSHVKRLCTFLEWVEEEHGIKVNHRYKKFKVLSEEKEVIYLDPQEIDMLWEFKMPQVKGFENKPWRLVQDIATFGALSGLRISDIKRSRFNLDVLKRDRALEAKTKKTKGDYFIPIDLDPRIELILKKYEYNLDVITPNEFNKLIKKVLEYMYKEHDIHQTPIKYYRHKFKEEFTFEKLKHELYTSHCNRRSAVTNWHYIHGFSETEILAMLGSKSITELKKYLSKNPYQVQASVLKKVNENQERPKSELSSK